MLDDVKLHRNVTVHDSCVFQQERSNMSRYICVHTNEPLIPRLHVLVLRLTVDVRLSRGRLNTGARTLNEMQSYITDLNAEMTVLGFFLIRITTKVDGTRVRFYVDAFIRNKLLIYCFKGEYLCFTA